MNIPAGQLDILLSCLVAWFLAQVIKAFLARWHNRALNPLQAIVATGGMPSAHAASVSALAAAIFLQEGLSTAFAVALVLMFVTLRDAVGVRLAAGEQAKLINELLAKLNHDHPALHIDHGHTPAQVAVGVVVGVVTALVVFGLM